MKYIMKSGRMFSGDDMLLQIKGAFSGPEKRIMGRNGRLLLRTDIIRSEAGQGRAESARDREYIADGYDGERRISALPEYAEGSDPRENGWPISHMPRIDRAGIECGGASYLLKMENDQNYRLTDADGRTVIEIFHRGLGGGWNIEAPDGLAPETVAAVFIFSKYIEEENEFLIV